MMRMLIFYGLGNVKAEKTGGSYGVIMYNILLFKYFCTADEFISETPV
jgi:hypothetical protein